MPHHPSQQTPHGRYARILTRAALHSRDLARHVRNGYANDMAVLPTLHLSTKVQGRRVYTYV
jgi:hypothetical protein